MADDKHTFTMRGRWDGLVDHLQSPPGPPKVDVTITDADGSSVVLRGVTFSLKPLPTDAERIFPSSPPWFHQMMEKAWGVTRG